MTDVPFIGKTKNFAKWAKHAGMTDDALRIAVHEMEQGLIDADLGGGVVKKRVALPGRGKRGSSRILLATNKTHRWIFIFGFEKRDRANVTANELEALHSLAKDLLALTESQIEAFKVSGRLIEVAYAEEKVE